MGARESDRIRCEYGYPGSRGTKRQSIGIRSSEASRSMAEDPVGPARISDSENHAVADRTRRPSRLQRSLFCTAPQDAALRLLADVLGGTDGCQSGGLRLR